jgi:phosphotriesterase-related protein
MRAMTVLGPVACELLGITLMHEHLIHTVSAITGDPDEAMGDEQLVADELDLYALAGGRTVVDLTTTGIGPSPAALRRLATATGLQIVAGTGNYIEDSLPAEVRAASEDEIYATMRRNLVEGFPGTAVQAGIIGEIGCGTLQGSEITPFEERMLCAAARAQQETGAAICVHTQIDFGPQGLWVLDILEAAGADLTRVILAHCDARMDRPYYHALLERGAVVEFSAIGRNRHASILGDGNPVPNTEERIKHLARLLIEGYASQLLISHDICSRLHLKRFGGGGFSHLLVDTIARLRDNGVGAEAIDTMLIHNPARLLGTPK